MYRNGILIRLTSLGIIALALVVSVFISPAQPVLAAVVSVDVTITSDAINASDGCSLREAIALGNSTTALTNDCGTTAGSADTVSIDFDIDGSGPHYITITTSTDSDTTGDFDITRPMSINNTSGEQVYVQGCAAETTPSCTGLDRIFHIQSGVGLTANAVRISNLNIRNGSNANAGGVYVQGSVTLDSVTISNSGTSNGNGGGMYIQPGQTATVTVINSTFSGNRSYRGAAVYANTANVTLTFTNTTFYGHSVFSGGWVVNADNGTLVLQNSVIAASGGAANCSGAGISGTYNFTENCATLTDSTNSTTALTTDDISASLASNGGPTLTHAIPGNTSDLVNAGSDALITATTDQRGYTRKVGTVDVGSYEFGASAPDTTDPTVTINKAADQDDPTEDTTINFTVVFSEAVTGFATGDVTLTGTAGATTATVSEISPNDGTTYNVAVTGMTSPGTVIASIAADVAQDAATNGNVASTSTDNSVDFQDPDPTVTIEQASGQDDPTNDTTIDFTVVFSEDVTGFETGDVTLTGTAGATTATVTAVDAKNYTVAVTGMTNDGTVIASINADVATGSLSGGNEASTSTDNTVTYDATAPTVTVEQAGGQDDPALVAPINFTVTFSEPVTGFTDADVTLGGTAGATNAAVTEVSPTDGTTYNVAVSGMTSAGTVTASVGADLAEDEAGNGNPASTSTDNEVTFAPVVPVVTGIVRASANPTTAASVDYTVTFSEDVTGVDETDFDVATTGLSGGSVTGVTGSGSVYTVTVSTGTGNDGTLQLNLVDDDTIIDGDSNALGGTGATNGDYSGEVYSVRPSAPPPDDEDDDEPAPSRQAAPPPAPATIQNFMCANLGAVTNNSAQAGPGNAIRDGVLGDLYCSIFALDGNLLNGPAIGNQSVLDQGVVQAIDVYGLLPGGVSTDTFTGPVRFCLRGTGSILFIHFDPVAMTNVVTGLPTVASPAGYTCADVPSAGIVVLVGSMTSVAPASAPVEPVPSNGAVCVPTTITTTHRVNLRAEASVNSADIGDVPFDLTLQVTDAAPGWYKVIFMDGQGWVSADYVTTQGC